MKKNGNPEGPLHLPPGTLVGEEATTYLKQHRIYLADKNTKVKGVLPPKGFVPPAERATLNTWTIQTFTGIAFEYWCAQRLAEQNWTAVITMGAVDRGTDILAISFNRRIAVSCKHSSRGNKVISRWIRDLRGSALEWLCKESLLITNSELTLPATKSATSREFICHTITKANLCGRWAFPNAAMIEQHHWENRKSIA